MSKAFGNIGMQIGRGAAFIEGYWMKRIKTEVQYGFFH